MRILITNDDGIHSLGLEIMAKALREYGDVTIVAPDTERSAVGHSITLSHPLRVKEIKKDGGFFGYAVNGTPADCVKIALGAIMQEPSDIVVAGINHGLNVGTNIMYSGTVSGAMEGAILGVPALAVSADTEKNEEDQEVLFAAGKIATHLVKLMNKKGLPHRTMLNVNVPECIKTGAKGIMITRQGQTLFRDRFQKRFDPRKDVYYWLEGEDIGMEGGDELDYWAIRNGYISITPLGCDLTYYDYIKNLKEWIIMPIDF